MASSVSAISNPDKWLCSYFLVTTNVKLDWLFGFLNAAAAHVSDIPPLGHFPDPFDKSVYTFSLIWVLK